MSLPTQQDLVSLQAPQDGPCVSIYMPVHPKGSDAEQDRLRFRKLTEAASDELTALGQRRADIDATLRPAREMIGERPFWKAAEQGIAMLLAPEHGRILHLPFPVPELVVTGERFHLRPIVFGLQPDLEYYVLALARRGVRLFKASRFAFAEVRLNGIPKGLEEVLSTIESERPFQARTAAREGPRNEMVYHGHGGERDEDDERLREYFRLIDERLQRMLAGTQARLVLAGIDYLLPIYREITGYKRVLEQASQGNPDAIDDEALHALTWALIHPEAQEHAAASGARLEAHAGRGEALFGIGPILDAAMQGRVDAVFVADDAVLWGQAGRTRSRDHGQRQPGDEDLLDRVVLETLANGGGAFSFARERMPQRADVAAVLRY